MAARAHSNPRNMVFNLKAVWTKIACIREHVARLDRQTNDQSTESPSIDPTTAFENALDEYGMAIISLQEAYENLNDVTKRMRIAAGKAHEAYEEEFGTEVKFIQHVEQLIQLLEDTIYKDQKPLAS